MLAAGSHVYLLFEYCVYLFNGTASLLLETIAWTAQRSVNVAARPLTTTGIIGGLFVGTERVFAPFVLCS